MGAPVRSSPTARESSAKTYYVESDGYWRQSGRRWPHEVDQGVVEVEVGELIPGLDDRGAFEDDGSDLGRCEFVAADANVPGQATEAVERARSLLGSIDVLLNTTTATYVPTLLHEVEIEDIAGIITQQALAPMHMTRAVMPVMRAQRGGAIINIASDAAKVNAFDALMGRVRECQRVRDHRVNLVAVNFYREGDVFQVVNALNGVD